MESGVAIMDGYKRVANGGTYGNGGAQEVITGGAVFGNGTGNSLG